MSNARSRMGAFGRTPKALLRDGTLSARAKVVVAIVDEVAGYEEVTMERLAEWLGCTVDTARRAVHEARDAGWLEVVERHEHGRQIASGYIANGSAYQSDAPEETRVRPPKKQEGGLAFSATPSPGENQEGNIRDDETLNASASSTTPPPKKKGTRLDPKWSPDDDLLAWAREHAPGVSTELETEKFVDYWCAKAGATATKLDWRATWRNWMRTAYERTPQGRAAPSAGVTAAQESAARDDRRREQRLWLEARGSSLEEYERRKDEPGWFDEVRKRAVS